MFRATLCLALLAVGACSKPPPAPYVRSHVDADAKARCLFWPDRNITWRVDPALSARTPGDSERDAVTAAIGSWAAVAADCSDVTFTRDDASLNYVVWYETPCSEVVSPGDSCHTRGDCATAFRCWDYGAETLAVTLTTYSRSTGRLLDANIKLNGAGWLFTTVDSPVCAKDMPATDCVSTDVQNTVTHEFGHLLGFDHSSAPGSTMLATAPPGELTKRAIDDGTRAGFCAVYPRGAPSPSCDAGM